MSTAAEPSQGTTQGRQQPRAAVQFLVCQEEMMVWVGSYSLIWLHCFLAATSTRSWCKGHQPSLRGSTATQEQQPLLPCAGAARIDTLTLDISFGSLSHACLVSPPVTPVSSFQLLFLLFLPITKQNRRNVACYRGQKEKEKVKARRSCRWEG